MKAFVWLIGALFFVSLGCSRDEPVPYAEDLIGNWRLYETGGSPGFGYYITPIPATPLQQLDFKADGAVVKVGAALTSLPTGPYYRIDSTGTGRQLVFLGNRGSKTGYSVNYAVKGDTLRIVPTCYEGCHYTFVRL